MKISIIIPIFNKDRYLKFLFSDIIGQTFEDYECILVDDGSSDASGTTCDDICRKDSRFTVYHIKNSGVSAARNYGLRYAKGEYITFIDSDDRLYPTYLENMYQKITENNVDIVISGFEKFYWDKADVEQSHVPYEGIQEKHCIMSNFAQVQETTGVFGFCWAKLFHRTLVEEIEFDETLKLAEDFDFYMKVYPRVKTFYFESSHNYRYLQLAEHSSSMVRDYDIDYVKQLIVNLRYRDFLISEAAFDGDNRRIVEEKINNYIYFSLFYSPLDSIDNRCTELVSLIEENDIVLRGKTWSQRLFLRLLGRNQAWVIKTLLGIYRFLRKIKHMR